MSLLVESRGVNEGSGSSTCLLSISHPSSGLSVPDHPPSFAFLPSLIQSAVSPPPPSSPPFNCSFQEALHNQVLDLQTLLGPSFSHVGVGRNDGKTDGEYAPIFFDNSRYEQVESQTIWLSSSRKVGSVGWDAVSRLSSLSDAVVLLIAPCEAESSLDALLFSLDTEEPKS
jgi:hypothetical protein